MYHRSRILLDPLMPRNDPTDTGGLFIGRRPGTAPRALPPPTRTRRTGRRRGPTRCSRPSCSCVETLVCLTLWGPQPIALAVGRLAGRLPRRTRSASGSLVAFVGHDRDADAHAGARVAARPALAASCAAPPGTTSARACWRASSRHGVVARARVRLLVPDHRGPGADAGADSEAPPRLLPAVRGAAAGGGRRASCASAATRSGRARSLFVPELDLGRTAWHEPPHAEAVNAATFALRRALNAYPDPAATAARAIAAQRHGVAARAGRGRPRRRRAAARALRAAARRRRARSSRGRAGARCRDLAQRGGRPAGRRSTPALDALAARARSRTTRAVALCEPQRPDGRAGRAADVRALCERVGERVWLLLDEALADFLEPARTPPRCVAELPSLLVVPLVLQGARDGGLPRRLRARPDRRAGRAADALVRRQRARAGRRAWAVELGDPVLARRRAAAARERERLARALHGTSLSFPPTAAPFVWLARRPTTARRSPSTSAPAGSSSRPGSAGATTRHVRVTLRDAAPPIA